MIIPFDAPSAIAYGNIFFDKKVSPDSNNQLDSISRKHIKADIMILASSVSAGMSVLYSEDEDLLKIAEMIIPAYPMIDGVHQLSWLDTIPPQDDEPE